MKQYLTFLLLIAAGLVSVSRANSILIPMDNEQANHLKAYGIAYKVLKDDQDVDWLLNYRGGSFLMKQTTAIETECRVRGVSFETISDSRAASIRQQLSDPDAKYECGHPPEGGQNHCVFAY